MKYLQSLLIGLLPVMPVITHIAVYTKPCMSPTDSLRTVLPVTIKYEEKEVTPFVYVTVDGKVLKAVFDTGSSGLRVLAGALPATPDDTLNKRVAAGYGELTHKISLKGKVRSARVGFGNIAPVSPIRIMCIDSAKYGPNGDWLATGDSALIKSGHFRNCPAIMGVGLRGSAKRAGISSPLNQLPGNGKFIVLFPGYGGSKGSVIINPTPEDETGFVYFQLAPENSGFGWIDNNMPGCISINETTAYVPTLLDSGTSDIEVFSSDLNGDQTVPSRNYITLRVGGLKDTVFVKTGFSIGDEKARGNDYVYLKQSQKGPAMIFGIRFFFEFDVLYDQQNGRIGIRKKLHKK